MARIQAQLDRKPMAAISTKFRMPREGQAVLCWTRARCESSEGLMARFNAMEGVFENGFFVVNTDKYSIHEVQAWADLPGVERNLHSRPSARRRA